MRRGDSLRGTMKVLPALLAFLFTANIAAALSVVYPLSWPSTTRESKPWTYWWWMASAVDPVNITHELERYRDAGLGGVHIIPIYGANGFEDRFIEYLSPKWMEMLRHTVTEARRLGLDVDMTTGSGWCMGGPDVSDADANAVPVVRTFDVSAGAKFVRDAEQAMVAFSDDGKTIEVTDAGWIAPEGKWRVYAISQKPSGQKVKRAGPGGAGHMLNLFYPEAMERHLRKFTDAFASYDGPKPRAMYHDSYEYRSEWSPDFLAQFEKRRGYRLQTELPALFGKEDIDRAARVKSDYRETASDLMIEGSLPQWVKWSHDRGFITRNEAHGSPGNLLDLYALADIPETEMFHLDRNILVSKMASSAAHVTGKNLVSAETGTWLAEHFTETLGGMKGLVDELFVSGVNHVFFHGTCYSPDEAPWPGWVFYASTEMNPRNAIWRDLPGLAKYIERCQSLLQSGRADNDVLLYWPIHDTWHDAKGMVKPMTVHARSWLEDMPFGKTAARLWERGFTFDAISDRQLSRVFFLKGKLLPPGGEYRAIIVPACEHMPLATLERLIGFAEAGATIIFDGQLPKDVPGWGDLEKRRAAFAQAIGRLTFNDGAATVGRGRVLVGGDLGYSLASALVDSEPLADRGLLFIRRAFDGGHTYFVANRSAKAVDDFIPLAVPFASAAIMDPMSGRAGMAAMRGNEVRIQLQPGESVVLRAFTEKTEGFAWRYAEPDGEPIPLTGNWQVKFLEGGPELPADLQTTTLASWTDIAGDAGRSFAGTAQYRLAFDSPPGHARAWQLDLGRVAASARVALNGRDLGILFAPPFTIDTGGLRERGNELVIEVTNTSANRLRDLDRRGVQWRTFHDINVVNIDYKPLNAADWPVADSGLLGPVRLIPVRH